MKKYTTLALVMVLMVAGPLFACGKEGQTASAKDAGCSKHAETAAPSEGNQVASPAVEQIMHKLPHLTYRVGDFETCCPKAAAEKAGETGQIVYVVAGETFDCRGKAMVRLAALLEAEVDKMMTVSYAVGEESFDCPTLAKAKAESIGGKVTYRLAGFDFNTREEAAGVAATVSEAVARLAAAQGQPEAQPAAGHAGCGKHRDKGEAQTTGDQSGSEKGEAQTASDNSGGDKPCHHGKADTASGKSGCNKSCGKGKAQTASAGEPCAKDKSDACCGEAETRVSAALAKLDTIVRTAASAQQS